MEKLKKKITHEKQNNNQNKEKVEDEKFTIRNRILHIYDDLTI